MHTPAQGARPPGRSCGAAEGQAGLAVTQKATQAQAAGSWTLQGREGQGLLSTGASRGPGKCCRFKSHRVESGRQSEKGTENELE